MTADSHQDAEINLSGADAPQQVKRRNTASSSFLFAQRYKAFFESTSDGIIIISPAGEIVDANPIMTRLSGYPFRDLVRKSVNDLFDARGTARLKKRFRNVDSGETAALPAEFGLTGISGDTRIVEITVTLLKEQYGYSRCYMAILHDVTLAKAHEADLVRQAEELQKVFDAVPTILLVIDSSRKIKRINRSGLETLDFDPEDSGGLTLARVLSCSRTDTAHDCGEAEMCRDCAICTSLNRSLDGGETVLNEEITIFGPEQDTPERYYLLNAVPLEKMESNWCVLSLQNITVRKRAELKSRKLHDSIAHANMELKRSLESLAKSQSQLMLAQKLEQIGLLASGLAHNLRTPLGGIKGYTQLLKADYPGVEEFDLILEEVNIMEATINNLMLKNRRDQKKEEDVVNINQLIELELEFLSANLFFKHQVDKKVSLDPALPSLIGIYSHFSQSFLNIVQNALDAMYDSPVKELTVRTRHDKANIYVDVIDTGCGIPAEIQHSIFEPFFTTKPESRKGAGDAPAGTGIGLGSARQMVRKYGGSISISSDGEKGTSVTITIPLKEEETDERLRVLIVDDAPTMVDLISRICEDIGAKAYGLHSGDEALNMFSSVNPHVVVTDLLMPGLTGPDLMARIRKIHPDQRVIYITGYSENPEFLAWIEMECEDEDRSVLVRKPFDISDFKTVLLKMAKSAERLKSG